MIHNKKPVVFCDYDGTATEHDVIQMVLEQFARPGWQAIVRQILDDRTLSIKDGIIELFRMLPGDQRDAMHRFVIENVKLRPGFEDFLTFCNARGIPFLVVSGGVDFLIDPILQPYREKLSVYCNTSRFYPDRIELDLPYYDENCITCDGCACCKIKIMNQYPAADYFRIVIGDSLTDLASARQADWVFARSRLIDYAYEDSLAVTPFETFYEIKNALADKLSEVSYV